MPATLTAGAGPDQACSAACSSGVGERPGRRACRRSWRNSKRSWRGGRRPSGWSGRNVAHGLVVVQRAEQVAPEVAVLARRLAFPVVRAFAIEPFVAPRATLRVRATKEPHRRRPVQRRFSLIARFSSQAIPQMPGFSQKSLQIVHIGAFTARKQRLFAATNGGANVRSGVRLDAVGDERAIASDEVAAGDGALRTCSAPPASETTKSSTSAPSRPTACARTPAGPGSTSSTAQLGHVAGAGGDERLARRGHPHLAQAGAPPACRIIRQVPGQASVARTSAGAHGAQAVGVARADEQRGRAEQDLAVDALGQVDAEERQVGVGHRVDQRAHERAALGLERAGRRRGTARCAGRGRRRAATASRSDHAPAQVDDAAARAARRPRRRSCGRRARVEPR